MSMAPMAFTTTPRRPFMADPTYRRSPIPSPSIGAEPRSNSGRPRPMVWGPGALMAGPATHAVTSLSPTPATPTSAATYTPTATCAARRGPDVVGGIEQDVALDIGDPHGLLPSRPPPRDLN